MTVDFYFVENVCDFTLFIDGKGGYSMPMSF